MIVVVVVVVLLLLLFLYDRQRFFSSFFFKDSLHRDVHSIIDFFSFFNNFFMTSQFIQRCNYGALVSGGLRKQASIGILHNIYNIYVKKKIGCKNVYYLND